MRQRPALLVLSRASFLGLGFALFSSNLLYGVKQTPIRTGLWVIQKLPDDATSFDEFSSQVRANHSLNGVCLHIPWNQIEQGPGKTDFSAIDRAVDVLR